MTNDSNSYRKLLERVELLHEKLDTLALDVAFMSGRVSRLADASPAQSVAEAFRTISTLEELGLSSEELPISARLIANIRRAGASVGVTVDTGSAGQGLKFDHSTYEVPDRISEYGRLASAIFVKSFFESVEQRATDCEFLGKIDAVKLSGHDSSPSVDGCGDLTVGDGEAVGVGKSAPAVDAERDDIGRILDAFLRVVRDIREK